MSHIGVDLFPLDDPGFRKTMGIGATSGTATRSQFRSIRVRLQRIRREVCVWIFALVIALLVAFPPWVGFLGRTAEYPSREAVLWHSPLWHRPEGPGRAWTVHVDYGRLLMEIVGAESLVIALYLSWVGRPGA